jgi:quercetin dioxygenase-like cupin family protein
MTNDDDARGREGGPSGTARKPHAQLTGPALPFDLDGEVRELRLEETWTRTGQNAKTLVKHPDFRIVLIVLRAGAHIREHQADARVSIQCLAGHLRLSLPDETVDLRAKHMVVLDKAVPHEVEALRESALLLSISWPRGADLGDQPDAPK